MIDLFHIVIYLLIALAFSLSVSAIATYQAVKSVDRFGNCSVLGGSAVYAEGKIRYKYEQEGFHFLLQWIAPLIWPLLPPILLLWGICKTIALAFKKLYSGVSKVSERIAKLAMKLDE
jgi:hypothetical protein